MGKLKREAEQHIEEQQRFIKELMNVVNKAHDLDGWNEDDLEYKPKKHWHFNHYYLTNKLSGLIHHLTESLGASIESYEDGEYDNDQLY